MWNAFPRKTRLQPNLLLKHMSRMRCDLFISPTPIPRLKTKQTLNAAIYLFLSIVRGTWNIASRFTIRCCFSYHDIETTKQQSGHSINYLFLNNIALRTPQRGFLTVKISDNLFIIRNFKSKMFQPDYLTLASSDLRGAFEYHWVPIRCW